MSDPIRPDRIGSLCIFCIDEHDGKLGQSFRGKSRRGVLLHWLAEGAVIEEIITGQCHTVPVAYIKFREEEEAAKVDKTLPRRPVRINEVIPFEASADGMFFAKIVSVSSRFWRADKMKCTPVQMEAIRRAAALLQAIMTGAIEIER